MIIEMRNRSQITIPKEIIKSMDIKEGDKFEVFEKDGGIFLSPVIVLNKEKLNNLAKKMQKLEKDSNKKSYKNVDAIFKDMGIDIKK